MANPKRPVIEYKVEVEPDDTPVKGNVLASGDDLEDRKAEDWVLQQMAAGNVAAWCTVKVEARVVGTDFVAGEVLGGCSYRSMEEIEHALVPEMRVAARASLLAGLNKLVADGMLASVIIEGLKEGT